MLSQRDYNAAIELTPLDKALYLERSVVLSKLARTRGALRDYATHLELDDGIVPMLSPPQSPSPSPSPSPLGRPRVSSNLGGSARMGSPAPIVKTRSKTMA